MDEPHPIPRARHWYVTPVLARTTEALERLAHTGAFIGVVKGPAGAGKSLLLARLAEVLAQDEQLAVAHLMTGAGKGGLLVELAAAFGVPTDGNPTQTRRALIQHLTGLHGSGRCPVVLIDAAERLSTLELSLLIRLGLSADKGKSGLMNVILAGSGDLDQRIAVAGEHLSRQRVYVAALPALTLEESLEFLARHTDTLPPRLQGAAGRRAISRTGGVPGSLIALLDDRPRSGRSLPVALVLATVIVTAIGAVLYRQLPGGFTGQATAQPPATGQSMPNATAPSTRSTAGPSVTAGPSAVAALLPASGPDTQLPAPVPPVGHDGAPEPATGSDARPPRPSGTGTPAAGGTPGGLPVPVQLPVPNPGAAQRPSAPEAPVTAPATMAAPETSVAAASETSPADAAAPAPAPATQPDAPGQTATEAPPAPAASPELPSASIEPPAATESPAPPASGAIGTPDAPPPAEADAVPPAVSGNGGTEAAAGPAPDVTAPAARTASDETAASADVSPGADTGSDPVRIVEAPTDSPAPATVPPAPPVPTRAPPAAESPPARAQGRPPAPTLAPPPAAAKPPARPRTQQPAAEPLSRAPDTAWVVQLAATESETRLRSYAERNGLSGYVILRTRRNGQDWHVLLLGGFHPNQAAAETALTRLPEALRSETTPWVRSVRSLRRLLPPADPAP